MAEALSTGTEASVYCMGTEAAPHHRKRRRIRAAISKVTPCPTPASKAGYIPGNVADQSRVPTWTSAPDA